MLLKEIPNRVLSLRSYRIVATMFKANAEQLKKDLSTNGPGLPSSLEEALAVLEAENQKIAALLADDVSLHDLDRDTDHVISSFRWFLFHWIEPLTSADYKALPPALSERLSSLESALAAFFPAGTAYLNETPKIQWTHLETLKASMAKPENAKHLGALGLSEEANWITEWIDIYGKRTGITDAEVSAKLAKLQEHQGSFQEVFDDFKIQVFASFKDNKNPTHLAHRATLMKPYVEEVEKLRTADRRAKIARAEKEKTKTTEEKETN
jgi:hypothetical protein